VRITCHLRAKVQSSGPACTQRECRAIWFVIYARWRVLGDPGDKEILKRSRARGGALSRGSFRGCRSRSVKARESPPFRDLPLFFSSVSKIPEDILRSAGATFESESWYYDDFAERKPYWWTGPPARKHGKQRNKFPREVFQYFVGSSSNKNDVHVNLSRNEIYDCPVLGVRTSGSCNLHLRFRGHCSML